MRVSLIKQRQGSDSFPAVVKIMAVNSPGFSRRICLKGESPTSVPLFLFLVEKRETRF